MNDVILIEPLETLGSEVASRGRRFADFEVYPTARDLLARFSTRARLGVFSLDPSVPLRRLEQQLSSKSLMPPIDGDLVAVATPDDPTPFQSLLAAKQLVADRVVFVALDAGQRVRALSAGLRVAPHLALAGRVLASESLQFARLSRRQAGSELPWSSLIDRLGAVPVHRTPPPDSALYVIASSAELDNSAHSALSDVVTIDPLGEADDVSRTTLCLLQVTRQRASEDTDLEHFVTGLKDRGFPVVHETPEGWLVALPGDRSLDDVHPPLAGAGHGHTRILLPSLSHMKPPMARPALEPRRLSDGEQDVLQGIDATAFQLSVEPHS